MFRYFLNLRVYEELNPRVSAQRSEKIITPRRNKRARRASPSFIAMERGSGSRSWLYKDGILSGISRGSRGSKRNGRITFSRRCNGAARKARARAARGNACPATPEIPE